MVKNSFIEKTYVVGIHWNCLCESTTYVTENKENYLEIYSYQVSCPLSLPLLNIPNCQSVLKFLSLYCKLFILHDSYISKFEFMNYLFANLLVARLYLDHCSLAVVRFTG